MADFLDQAMYSLLGHTNPGQSVSALTKQHYQHVIEVLVGAMKPFGRINYGSISDHALQQALNKAFQAMTLQERSQYQSE